MKIVRIIKCSSENSWYENEVGNNFEVGKETYGPQGYGYITKNTVGNYEYGFIRKNDCEVVFNGIIQ